MKLHKKKKNRKNGATKANRCGVYFFRFSKRIVTQKTQDLCAGVGADIFFAAPPLAMSQLGRNIL